jgi:hypothetical protein
MYFAVVFIVFSSVIVFALVGLETIMSLRGIRVVTADPPSDPQLAGNSAVG